MPIKHKIAPAATQVIARLHEAGYEGYLVGGAVRDLMLDIEPKDYDIATDATPKQVKAVFRSRARIIGRRFRLVHVYQSRRVFEVSTFRRKPSLQERKGREDDDGLRVWRDNEFGTLEQDAYRRDFTVNAIYYDPLNEASALTDLVGGVKDMEEKLVRTIGDAHERIAEDPVRILRAAKLVGQYGFSLTEDVDDAVRSAHAQITECSQARLLEELNKILKKPFTLPTFTCMQEIGLLQHLLPTLSQAWDTDTGRLTRELLAQRDRLMQQEEAFPSRVTGLAAMILPFALERFGTSDPAALWHNFGGIDRELQHLVKEFLAPYNVPRHMSAKIRDALLLQPKLLSGRSRKRMQRHPEYNRSRDLFEVCVPVLGIDPELLATWPRQQPEEYRPASKKGSGSKRGRKTGKKRGRKKPQGKPRRSTGRYSSQSKAPKRTQPDKSDEDGHEQRRDG